MTTPSENKNRDEYHLCSSYYREVPSAFAVSKVITFDVYVSEKLILTCDHIMESVLYQITYLNSPTTLSKNF